MIFFFENLYHNCSTSPAVCINSRPRYYRVASAFVGPAAERTWLMSFLLFWRVLIVCAAQRRCFQLHRAAERKTIPKYLPVVCKPCFSWVVAVSSDVYIAGVDDDRGRFWKVLDAKSDAIHSITLLRWRTASDLSCRRINATFTSGEWWSLGACNELYQTYCKPSRKTCSKIIWIALEYNKKVDLYLFLNPRKVLIPCKRTLRNKRQLFIASCRAHLLHPGLSSSSLWWHRFFPSSVTFCSVGSRCCNSHTANVVVVRLRGRPIRYGASAACSRYAISRDIPYRPATTVNSFFLQSECIIYAQVVLTLPSLQVYFMLCMVCWLLQDHVGFGDLTYINTYKWVVEKYSNKYL